MIEAPIAANQIKRLSGLSFYPVHQEAIDELILALQVADGEWIAKSTIDDLLHDAIECPKPSEIRRIANLKNDAEMAKQEPYWMRGPEPPRTCPECQGFGTKGQPPNAD